MNNISISAIVTNSARSQSYLQNFIKAGIQIDHIIYLRDISKGVPSSSFIEKTHSPNYKIGKIHKSNLLKLSFDSRETIDETIEKNQIPHTVFDHTNIHASEVIKAIKTLPGKDVIFSGPGGLILKKEMFLLGKRFLHAHPGRLPQYRGSTTFYYSLIEEGLISASVIEMNEGIDTGKVLQSVTAFDKECIDIDGTFDPLIRTAAFLKLFNSHNNIIKKDQIECDSKQPRTFYTIHPVLKHIAMEKTL